MQRRGFADRERVVVDGSVLLRAADHDDRAHVRARARVEQVARAADVHGGYGVAQLERLAHVRQRGEVVHRVGLHVGDAPPHRVGVGDVGRGRAVAVEADHGVALRLEVRDEMAADEAARAGDERAHGVRSRVVRARSARRGRLRLSGVAVRIRLMEQQPIASAAMPQPARKPTRRGRNSSWVLNAVTSEA